MSGIYFDRTATPATAMLTDTTLRNMSYDGINGLSVMLTMIGGELSGNGQGGLEAFGGTWTLDNVTLKQNRAVAVYTQGDGSISPVTLAMRGCTITNNAIGVYLFDSSIADLGTVANPGMLANTQGHQLSLGRHETLVKVAEAWSVQRIVERELLGDTLSRLFHNTPLHPLLDKLVPPRRRRLRRPARAGAPTHGRHRRRRPWAAPLPDGAHRRHFSRLRPLGRSSTREVTNTASRDR